MKEGEAVITLTSIEREMLASIAHMWDATPEIIASLRQQCAPFFGARASDYMDPPKKTVERFWKYVERLRKVGTNDLLIAEPPALGGFGFTHRSDTYNEDTLKFCETLTALQLGGVLGQLQRDTGGDPRVVWEIGGGWGGLAYRIKTICPDVTYVITSPPDLFLLSAVYLMTAFPGAGFRFYDPGVGDAIWRELEGADFIFVPESAVEQMTLPDVDLTIDVMVLEHMTEERARSHVEQAFELGSRYLYSVCPSTGVEDADRAPVRRLVERRYWPHAMPLPRMRAGEAFAGLDGHHTGVAQGISHEHLVGWRRFVA